MKTYVLIGDHAENLTSGGMLEPSERIAEGDLALTAGDKVGGDQWLVDDGRLVDVESFGPSEVLSGQALKDRAKELEIDGYSTMKADALRAAIAEREAEIAAQTPPDPDPAAAATPEV